MISSIIIGCGGYLPANIVTNEDLSKKLDTNDEWIKSRTGITKRHIASKDEYTSDLALKAAKSAIADARIDSSEIDLIMVCTNTPDHTFPSVANKIQGKLCANNIPSMDLQAICSGFLYGLHMSDALIKTKKYKTILLVAADKMSNILDWEDRATCVLFGDGAGAVILRASNEVDSVDMKYGLIDSAIHSDGRLYDILKTSGGPGSNAKAGTVLMMGQEVFKEAINKMHESVSNICKDNDIKLSDIDYFIPHQANIRIINAIAEKFKMDSAKVITTVTEHANCSASSIGLAMWELNKKKTFKKGDLIAFTSFGAGASWGAALYRWI